jgi:uncharacterized phage protein gp47/JayE
MEYGLTANGFISKPLHVLLEEERAAYKAAFGDDIDISDDSVAGKYIGNQVVKFTQLWELLDGLWSIGDVDSAKGIYLDRLAMFVNVLREPAIPTEVTECIWGDEGTVIHARSLLKTNPFQDLFYLRDAVTISRDKLLGVQIKVSSVEAGAAYEFQIKGVTIGYIASDEDDEETIHLAIKNIIEVELPELFMVENLGGDGLKIHVTDGITPFVFDMNDEKLEIVLLGAYSVYLAQVPGPIYVPIGTLTLPVSNVSGVDSVFNYATGLTGRIVESDTELRINLGNRQKQASSNEIAIQNEIEKVPGVEYAKVYSNRTMQTHNGRPPKSYEAVVGGGDEKTIAQTIFDAGPAGVEPFGNTHVSILDSEGNSWEIGFSRPVNQYIWIKIVLRKNLEEQYPINGNDLIKDNIIRWASENSGVGVDFIYQRIGIPIYAVSGIAEAEIKVARTANLTPPADSDYKSENIEIGEVEIAVFDRNRITVEEKIVE